MALRTRWLALVIAFLWGALGMLHPEAPGRPASADAKLAPPGLVLAPRRALPADGPPRPDAGAPDLDEGVLARDASAESRAAGSTGWRSPRATPDSSEAARPRARGPPPAHEA